MEKFDPNLTEHENVLALNVVPIEGEENKFKSVYRQIYDAGNLVLHYMANDHKKD